MRTQKLASLVHKGLKVTAEEALSLLVLNPGQCRGKGPQFPVPVIIETSDIWSNGNEKRHQAQAHKWKRKSKMF